MSKRNHIVGRASDVNGGQYIQTNPSYNSGYEDGKKAGKEYCASVIESLREQVEKLTKDLFDYKREFKDDRKELREAEEQLAALAEQNEKMTKPNFGRDGLMAIAAFRYCLGRMTYIVSDCADWLIEQWPILPDNVKAIIKRDLDAEIKVDDEARAEGREYKPLGHDCDRASWLKVRKMIEGLEQSNG